MLPRTFTPSARSTLRSFEPLAQRRTEIRGKRRRAATSGKAGVAHAERPHRVSGEAGSMMSIDMAVIDINRAIQQRCTHGMVANIIRSLWGYAQEKTVAEGLQLAECRAVGRTGTAPFPPLKTLLRHGRPRGAPLWGAARAKGRRLRACDRRRPRHGWARNTHIPA